MEYLTKYLTWLLFSMEMIGRQVFNGSFSICLNILNWQAMDLCDYRELQFFNKLEMQQERGLLLSLDTSILHGQLPNVERVCRDFFTSVRKCGRCMETSL